MKSFLAQLARPVVLISVLLCAANFAVAQQEAVVIHNVNLRSDPSSQHKAIRHLAPPDMVTLLETGPTNGYLHIRTSDDEEGWVFAKYLRVLSAGELPPESSATAPAAPVPGTAPSEISSDWDKPTPPPTTFTDSGKTCGPSGKAGDTPTNLLKNRTDIPASYHSVSFDAVATLAYPSGAPKHRHDWTAAQLEVIKPVEGVAITVEGYIVAIKPQTGGSGESTNCHWTQASQVDWHIALTKNAGEGEKDAVVVETTPRVRQSHPKWTTTALAPWKNTDAPVRISGWLMLDPEHTTHLGKYRCTLWEIHPITKIELFSNGQWTELK
jgi:uncharacterized protein YraI